MNRILKHFRLLAIIVCIAAVLLLQLRSSYLVELWKEAYHSTWKRNLQMKELMIYRLIKDKLYEPFSPVHKKVKSFIGAETDVKGFKQWLLNEAVNDSLIGAGFIWQRDIDSLVIIQMTIDVDKQTLRNLSLYIEPNANPDLVGPPQPNWVYFYKDSLRRQINKKVGFETYKYSFYEEFKTRRQRAEALQFVLGIIWNPEHYRNRLMPALTEDITADPRKYGLSRRYKNLTGRRYHGALILDAERDTVFSQGRIDLESEMFIYYSMTTGYINWNSPNHHPMKYFPGWSFMVQDRWNWEYMSTDGLKSVAYQAFPGGDTKHEVEEEYNEPATALIMMLVGLLQPLQSHHAVQWMIAFIAVVVLFLMILNQIAARNRQRDFIAHISHELRTPVSRVKLFAETLRNDRTVSEAKEDEYLDHILHASDHLSVLIDNTLNLARLDAGKFIVNPSTNDMAEWLIKFYNSQLGFYEESGFVSGLNIESNLPDVYFDPEAMELVLRNLLDNAMKYSYEDKKIEIAAQRKDEKMVTIAVLDRGAGVPENKRRFIFKRFNRLLPKDKEPVGGAGIGLSIVKEIVVAHSGKVSCERRDGGGTSIKIDLPISR